MSEVTLADQRRLIDANIQAALIGAEPVSVESIVDITQTELRNAGLTSLDAIIGYAQDNPVKSGLGVVAALFASWGIYRWIKYGRIF